MRKTAASGLGQARHLVAAGFGAADYAQIDPRKAQAALPELARTGLILPRVVGGSSLDLWAAQQESIVIPYDIAPRLDLSPGWDAVAARRSGRTWSGFRRKAKRLKARGPVEIIHVTDSDHVQEWLPDVFRLYEARASVVRRRGVWKSKRGQLFLASWMKGLADEGALDLAILSVDGRAEAFTFVIADPDVHYLYALAFDPSSPVARDSPGEQLLVEAMKSAAGEGALHFDFLVGDESYKRAWATEFRPVSTRVVGGSPTSRRLISAPFAVRQALRNRLANQRETAAKVRK
ncbi:MAG: CelD/BcsL family acetyltransferase involved in cellulose biosynthesis [Rhodothermales bacterium]|jgi:CelD/BcsL family acetyltransferase involved in cellulose biosynthesis